MHVTDLKLELVLNRNWLLILIFNSKSYNLPSVIDVMLGWEPVALLPRMSDTCYSRNLSPVREVRTVR